MKHEMEKQLEEIKDYISTSIFLQKEFLTLAEAAIYAGISKSYLYKLTSQETISFYRPALKLIYFKRTELNDWILNNRSESKEEVNAVSINLKHKNHEAS